MRELDYLGDGRVNYSEFLAVTLSCKMTISEDVIWSTFKYFDRDSSGYITVENIQEILGSRGKILDDDEVMAMIQEVDLEDIDGRISFEEFKRMLLSNLS